MRCRLFFKPRTYLAVEFKAYLSCSTRALEVGCGHGCSVFPLVKSFPGMHFMATDYCDNALDILCTHPEYSPDRMQVTPWDATLPPPTSLACFAADVVLCVFALSAITPEQHVSCITHMSSLISDGGVVLFRDYGIADMTMYRHKRCLKHMLFERSDGTLAYYFTLEYLQSLADACGMSVVELEYATVLTRNRKSGLSCRRVFVHAVLRKHV